MPAQDVDKLKEVSGRGDGGAYGAVILGLWDTTDGSLFVLVIGTNVVVHLKRLAGGGTGPPEGVGKWGLLVKTLVREVADKRMAGRFYVVLVQAVLLFGSET